MKTIINVIDSDKQYEVTEQQKNKLIDEDLIVYKNILKC